ncbi:MAG: methylated-DNA--[protein]-cysteine S-methyltransferase [Gemmatimonadetes bacterium]|nr:methylated-DNA--[protein]-cysteine S-methyltransferase [Gemmatimonadota bacterium]
MKVAHAQVAGAGLDVHAWASAEGLVAIRLGPVPASGRDGGRPVDGISVEGAPPETLRSLARALVRYLEGSRLEWTGPLDLRGVTPFRQRVFDVVSEIPHGETRSYGAIAAALGRPEAVRAVGMALGRNPFPLVVPCHRVLRADGELGGYVAGGEVKRRLLALEAGQTELDWEAVR